MIGGLAAAGSLLVGGPAAGVSPGVRPASKGSLGADLTALVDLTVRWRHLAPRIVRTGIWADLLAGWTFDEGSGYSFNDVSGAGFSLFITGSDWNTTESGLLGAIHRAGLRGGAVRLNGTRWLAAAPTDRLAPDDRGVSITAWLRLDTLPETEATVVRIGPKCLLTIRPDGHAYWSVTTRAGVLHTLRSVVAVTTQVWTHLAVTVDPGGGSLDVFVDGTGRGHFTIAPFAMPAPATVAVFLGNRLSGLLDEATLHRGALPATSIDEIRLLGLPRVFTQTSQTVDADHRVYSRYGGSEPIPHPVSEATVMTFGFATDLVSDQGAAPTNQLTPTFVPAPFGSAWRAIGQAATYTSPLSGPAGTFETWYGAVPDASDPHRLQPHIVFSTTARSSRAGLVLSTLAGSWRVDLTSPTGQATSAVAPAQTFPPAALAHVAVSWGAQGETPGVHLFVDGYPAAFVAASPDATVFDGAISLGGTAQAPAYVEFADARVSKVALGWGALCPRGQAATDAAGLDLRDDFRRSPGLGPMWWRPGTGTGAQWTIAKRAWQHPENVGDDPDANLAVWQVQSAGLRTLFHPDAFGEASSIEAQVSVDLARDGWAGVFVQAKGPGPGFSGVTFMLNFGQNLVRLARYQDGRIVAQKSFAYDFTLSAKRVHTITLTSPGDGVVRGFVEQTNFISMDADGDWPTEGFAGLVTDGSPAAFSGVHFTALTPASAQSRVIGLRTLAYPPGAATATVTLVPFRWHKRRGLLPWQYVAKNPEPAGNIAGADSQVPRRPIPPARWRSEDSANSDLIVADGRVWYLMRGNPRLDERAGTARVGVLYQSVTTFDGIHFVDPNEHTGRISGGPFLLTSHGFDGLGGTGGSTPPTLNAPSSAYVGDHTLLFLGRSSGDQSEQQLLGETVYGRFDLTNVSWRRPGAFPTGWNGDPLPQRIRATPELISLRDPSTDSFVGVVYGQVGGEGSAAMGAALVENVADGVPELVGGSLVTSLQRPDKGAIYGFRVMFDNGIYYLHYNDGTQIPDWPDRFVLAATLDPHQGPWIVNQDSNSESSTYFRRGKELEPDNGAIWQGTMHKQRGHYYLYYENYHSIGDVNQQYGSYNALQAGSRVGYATA